MKCEPCKEIVCYECGNCECCRKWISVKEKLPEKHYQRILVYSYTGNIHVVNYFQNSRNSGTIWKCDAGFEGEDISFTHWMALPNPPTEESND